MDYGIICLLPPILAIVVAFAFKNAILALAVGMYSIFCITTGGHFIESIPQAVNACFPVLGDMGSVIVMVDITCVVGLMSVIEASGGINGLLDILTNKANVIKSKRDANIFTWLVGVCVFFSDNMSCLITGAVTKTLNKSFRVSKEKMAYIIHSTATGVCLLIPLGPWAAFCSALLSNNGIENSNAVVFQSVPFEFFSLIVVLSIPVLAILGKDFGPMKKAELRAEQSDYVYFAMDEKDSDLPERKTAASNLVIPVVCLLGFIIIGIFVTGKGNFFEGNGSLAFMYSNAITLLITTILYTRRKIMTGKEIISTFKKGCGTMVPLVFLLILAFSFGHELGNLGTGEYLGNALLGFMPTALFPMATFIMGCLIGFATGSSMGTMSIVAPLMLPTAISMGFNIPLVAGAIWCGAVFGDQSSPISDTTFLTCSTIECSPMDHIKTQLPYTVGAAVIACVFYAIFGFIL